MTKPLGAGDGFPSLIVRPVDGAPLRLPAAFAGQWAVVLFFRGAWCPYSNARLRAFQRAQDALSELDVATIALSVDDEETTRSLIAKHGIQFPVGYDADGFEVAEATGAFLNLDPTYLQSTWFVFGPDGKVIVSVYSSGAIGRLLPDDVAGLIRYLRRHAAA